MKAPCYLKLLNTESYQNKNVKYENKEVIEDCIKKILYIFEYSATNSELVKMNPT